MKRFIALFLILLCTVSVLEGCASKPLESPKAQQQQVSKAPEPKKEVKPDPERLKRIFDLEENITLWNKAGITRYFNLRKALSDKNMSDGEIIESANILISKAKETKAKLSEYKVPNTDADMKRYISINIEADEKQILMGEEIKDIIKNGYIFDKANERKAIADSANTLSNRESTMLEGKIKRESRGE